MRTIQNKIKNIRKPLELFVYAVALAAVLIINFLQMPKDELQGGIDEFIPGMQPVIISQIALLHDTPSRSSATVDTLSAEDEITVLQTENGWCKIQTESVTGWVRDKHLSHLYTALVDQDVMFLHNNVSENAETVAIHDSQIAVIVLEVSEEWARIQHGNLTFWIQRHHLSPAIQKTEDDVFTTHLGEKLSQIDLRSIANHYQAKAEYLAAHPELNQDIRSAILSGIFIEGMTKEQVAVTLGLPSEIKQIKALDGMNEQWMYTNGKWETYINFSGNTIQNWWQVSENLAHR